jgi:hypothetical protein
LFVCEGLGGVRVCVPVARWLGLYCRPLLAVALLGYGFRGWPWAEGRGGMIGSLRVVGL